MINFELTHFSSLVEVAIALNLLLQFPQATQYLVSSGAQKVLDSEPLINAAPSDAPEVRRLQEIVESLKSEIEDLVRKGHAVAELLNKHAKIVVVVLLVQLLLLSAFPKYELTGSWQKLLWWSFSIWAVLSPILAVIAHVFVVKRRVNSRMARLVLAAKEQHELYMARKTE